MSFTTRRSPRSRSPLNAALVVPLPGPSVTVSSAMLSAGGSSPSRPGRRPAALGQRRAQTHRERLVRFVQIVPRSRRERQRPAPPPHSRPVTQPSRPPAPTPRGPVSAARAGPERGVRRPGSGILRCRGPERGPGGGVAPGPYRAQERCGVVVRDQAECLLWARRSRLTSWGTTP